jgi:hypothetical protein
MAKASARSTAEIQRLLEEKLRIEQWLERLRASADKTPQHVRDRVANDYRNRLEGVIAQLQSYQDELATALHAQLGQRGELREKEARAAERLAEAELRHAVGEYDEGRWGEIRSEILESLVQIRESLGGVEGEIKTLEGVVSLLEPGGGAVGSFGEEEEVEPTGREAVSGRTSGSTEQVTAPSAEESEEGQTDAFDELAFLKSVTSESEAPRRGAARNSHDSADVPLEAERIKSVSAGERLPPRSSAKKTLKCVECGTMNLPTEWYCERCGAELAAL